MVLFLSPVHGIAALLHIVKSFSAFFVLAFLLIAYLFARGVHMIQRMIRGRRLRLAQETSMIADKVNKKP